MADLGSIATNGTGATGMPDQAPRVVLRGFSMADTALNLSTMGAKDTTEGDPSQPSLRMDARGTWRFRWVVESGARTASINVKQAANASPRPTLVIKANTAIGVNADVTGTAGSGTGWVTIGPVNAAPTGDGVLWVELRNNYDAQYQGAPCYWDHVVVT